MKKFIIYQRSGILLIPRLPSVVLRSTRLQPRHKTALLANIFSLFRKFSQSICYVFHANLFSRACTYDIIIDICKMTNLVRGKNLGTKSRLKTGS